MRRAISCRASRTQCQSASPRPLSVAPEGTGSPQSVPGLTLAWESWLYARVIPISRWESGKHLEGPRNPGKMAGKEHGFAIQTLGRRWASWGA